MKHGHENLENQLQCIIWYVIYVIHKGMSHDYAFLNSFHPLAFGTYNLILLLHLLQAYFHCNNIWNLEYIKNLPLSGQKANNNHLF